MSHSIANKDDIPPYLDYADSIEISAAMPDVFPDPFDPEPHPLARAAARHLQKRLAESLSLIHSFGLDEGEKDALGKMFGVLVVKDNNGRYGYLSAFSGKLQSGTIVPGFVPPVFDTLDPDGFYIKEEKEISLINEKICKLEKDPHYLDLIRNRETLLAEANDDLAYTKNTFDEAKKLRTLQRQSAHNLPLGEREALLQQLEKESMRHHFELKDRKKYWKNILEQADAVLIAASQEILGLKELRRSMSAALQEKLFQQYSFLNAEGRKKNLAEIFCTEDGILPPSGAGECTAPKLLHFAYTHGLHPVALAEFWWGVSPASEIRRHGHFYPACRSKCRPILGHMLQGLKQEELSAIRWSHDDLRILMEDDYLIVINKPPGMLAVPGKGPEPSVYSLLCQKYPHIQDLTVVHRLDMSTSGIMLIAKTKEAYRQLQGQFIRRQVRKKYVAILIGYSGPDKGRVDLPIRVDLDDRPRQMVCHDHGRQAVTDYEVLERQGIETIVNFYPLTGRTHQLRVHAAHRDGLNAPIKGDDLYGTKSARLCLHAEKLQFLHPISQQKVTVECAAEFQKCI